MIEIRINHEYPDLNEIINLSKQKIGKTGNFISYKYSKVKKQETNYTKIIIKNFMKKNNIKTFEKKIDIICDWYSKDRRKDPDNIQVGIKFILDGFVKAKLLKNDGQKQINSIVHHFFKSETGKSYIILKMKEVNHD